MLLVGCPAIPGQRGGQSAVPGRPGEGRGLRVLLGATSPASGRAGPPRVNLRTNEILVDLAPSGF
jgi:hypothetical protein